MPKTAKTIVIDIANNWGSSVAMGIRRVEFFLADVRDNFAIAGADTYESSHYVGTPPYFLAQQAFDVTLPKDGSWYNGWVSASSYTTNQRIICSPYPAGDITFDTIKINNFHSNGGSLIYGAKDIKIYITPDIYTDTTYNAAVTNGELLFDGQLPQHSAVNGADDYIAYSYVVHTNIPVIGSILLSPSMNTGLEISVSGSYSMGASLQKAAIWATVSVFGDESFDVSGSLSFSPSTKMNYSQIVSVQGSLSVGPFVKPIFDFLISCSGSLSFSQSANSNISIPVDTGVFKFSPIFSYADLSIITQNPIDVSPGHILTAYECVLGDLPIPISSYQTRVRNQTPSFLEVITSRIDLSGEISTRVDNNDELVLRVVYTNNMTGEQKKFEIVTVSVANINFQSGKSLIISGNKTTSYRALMTIEDISDPDSRPIEAAGHPPAPHIVDILSSEITEENVNYGAKQFVLARDNINIKPGDFARYDGTNYKIGSIECVVTPSTRRLVLTE